MLIERSTGLPTYALSKKGESPVMKITTIALAIAFAFPVTSAFAEGPMNLASSVAQPYRATTTATSGRIASRPPNVSGNTLAPIDHDPSGSTLTPSAMSRFGG
jgi:hypothetical protein